MTTTDASKIWRETSDASGRMTPHMTNDLIALYSPAPQSGKSTLAEHLTQHRGYELVKFAGPLKDMLRCLLFDHCGIDHATVERYVVIDDMRFQNEWMMVRDLGGQVVRIERGDVPSQDFSHASEGGLNNVPMTLLRNDGSLDNFLLAADRLLGYA
jgi:hypothetical protein